MTIRPARPEDAAAIAAIYNEGIAGRQATFETRPRDAGEVAAWIEDDGRSSGFSGRRPSMVRAGG